MEAWMKVSLILCTYGFFREFRPSEAFLTDFLSGEWRNLTVDQVVQDVYPWATYSYLTQLIIAFLITDMLRYKPLIVVSAIMGCVVFAMMLWTESLPALQGAEVMYGTYMATEVAYYTYIYAKVNRDRYQMVTGFTKSAILCGRFLAATVSQLLVSFGLMNLRQLNYLSFGSQLISVFWAIALPAVGTSLYFHAKKIGGERVDTECAHESDPSKEDKTRQDLEDTQPIKASALNEDRASFSAGRAVRLLWLHFSESYSDVVVVQWSVWWALAMCGFTQVQMYSQFLWVSINPDHENVYNGAVEAALTLLGAAGAFAAGFIESKRFERWNLLVLTMCSAVLGGVLLWGTLANSIWIAYATYIIFGTLTHFMVTVASVNVAKRLNDDSFGLVFGINTLMALVFQSILTMVVVRTGLDARQSFTVYSGYFVVLSAIYGVTGVVQMACGEGKTHKPSEVVGPLSD